MLHSMIPPDQPLLAHALRFPPSSSPRQHPAPRTARSKQDRAREGSTKANMHSFQLAIEDFAVKSSGTYPVAANNAAVLGNMPGGVYPVNPFSGARDAWTWVAPAASGVIGPPRFVSGTTSAFGTTSGASGPIRSGDRARTAPRRWPSA